MKYFLCVLAVVMAGSAAQAVELQLPANARQMTARDTVQDRFSAPIGPFADGSVPFRQVMGNVARSSWRIDQAGLTPLQASAPLRAQLEAAGFEVVLDCSEMVCGGYDFRFETEVLPAPNMYVNIRNFHALTALRGQEAVSILASASSGATFVQIIQAGSSQSQTAVEAIGDVVQSAPASQGSLSDRLSQEGHVVLVGLDFESGTSALGAGPFAVLAELSNVMEARPDLRMVLVGHTDNVGSLEGNIALSRSRANAVRQRLIDEFGIAPDRLEGQGMGYLAPLTTNETEVGREANRRVEAVILQN